MSEGDLEFSIHTPDEKWIMTTTPIYRPPSSNEPVILQFNNITGRIYGISLDISNPTLEVQLLMDGVERSFNSATPNNLFNWGFREFNPVFPYVNVTDPLSWHFTPEDERLGRFTESLKLSVACVSGVEVTGKVIWLKRPDSG